MSLQNLHKSLIGNASVLSCCVDQTAAIPLEEHTDTHSSKEIHRDGDHSGTLY